MPVYGVDLIARHKTFLLFVEVKTRCGIVLGRPAEKVGRCKQQQIARAARGYLDEQANKNRSKH